MVKKQELNRHLAKVKKANLERLRELKLKKKNNTLKGLEFEELRMLKTKYGSQRD